MVVNTTDLISLEPGEYRVYTDVKLAKPEMGLGSNELRIKNSGKSLIFPNPSNGEFNVLFLLKEPSYVEINIFDLNGRLLKTIFSGRMENGQKSFKWNGTDNRGKKLTKGIYFTELIVDGHKEVSKLIIN
jgi:hypothetical protein